MTKFLNREEKQQCAFSLPSAQPLCYKQQTEIHSFEDLYSHRVLLLLDPAALFPITMRSTRGCCEQHAACRSLAGIHGG